MSDPKSVEVLSFWFEDHAKDWFAKNPGFDAAVRSRFIALHEAAAVGHLSHWADEARSCLALVIVLDQFPRNMFRGDARAFSSDSPALAAAGSMIEREFDRLLSPVERTFAYLPFEHAEDLAAQRRSLALFQALDPEYIESARRHHEIIARFGRFPHRNAMLGRESTAEEIEFLEEPGSSF